MTALQWIVTEAKKLKKEYPKRFGSWKEYVAQASAIYAKKHKGKSPVGKKHKVGAVKKKTAVKKTAVKKSAPKKLAKKKAPARNYGSHKDTASHNVRISVVSGIGNLLTHYKDAYGKLSSKKLLEKTKRGKTKIAKEMTAIASKIKKLKNW